MDPLFKKYSNEAPIETPTDGGDNKAIITDPLFQKYMSDPTTLDKKLETGGPTFTGTVKRLGSAAMQGTSDVLNTIGQGIGYVDRLVNGEEGAKRSDAFNARVALENEKFKGENTEYPITGDIGRMAGQIAATAPLTPIRTIQAGANITTRALPTILSTGEKIAAPILNRIGALSLTGGVAGGEFNLLTHSARPETSLPVDIGTGVVTGAVGGPLTQGAVVGLSKAFSAAGNLWANISVSKLANEIGIQPSSAKVIIGSLRDAGYTPAEAANVLRGIGPKATLADLDPSLSAEASGLASFGGKPTSILKGAFADRAATADNDAVRIFESKFGKKPDVYVERGNVKGGEADKIVEDARALTSADYKAAHRSADKLDISGVASHLDDVLQTAVGRKAAVLNEIKSYLYRKDGSLKTSVKELHEARQGIDDIINNKMEGLPPNAGAAVDNVRKLVDVELKTNPQMAAADAKFAEKMKLKEGLQIGHDAITKGMNKQEFERVFDAATPEVQEKIKRGMLAAAGNIMEASSQGELSGAIRLFGKKDVNRSNFKHAFGSNAEDVLDEVHKATTFRAVEREIMHGAQTAERQSYQRKYGMRDDGPGIVSSALKGAAVDLATGSPGGATSVMAIRNMGSGAKNRMLEINNENTAIGAADLFSRSGVMRDSALGAIGKIEELQSRKMTTARDITSRLPVIAGTPLLDYIKEKAKKL